MITKQDTFSELVHQNKYLISIFDRFGVNEKDYHFTIAEIGKKVEADPDFMVAIFNAFDTNYLPDIKLLRKFPIGYILQYLRNSHQYYLDKKIPEIELSLQDIIRRHSEGDAMLYALGKLFIAYKRKLTDHIMSEEQELFPYIDSMIDLLRYEPDYNRTKLLLGNFSLSYFEASHHNVEDDVQHTKETIYKFSPPQSSAMSFRIFLNQLELFEADLYRHSLIEDEVLVPKAQMIEDMLKDNMKFTEHYILNL